ncbi:MAG: hypothetical protein E7286_08540 [Lachnospiraceae bacterium]|nr:hypothetical protein [Lachnospiraceae bacterium]
MDVLLSLSISCVTPENYWAEYPIGFFASAEEIDVVVKRLMSNSGNFSESHCKVRIEEVEVVGESKRNTPRQQWHLETHIIGKSNY